MPRIAIPLPHSSDREYAERAIPPYERAVELAGGVPIRIPLDQPQSEIKKLIATCHAVLLPGSKADVDPAKFHAPRSPRTAPADVPRNTVDELLLEDAYRQRKPILGICYGLQSLNVFRSGSLIQHIPDFLPEETRAIVDHEAGKKVAVAHNVEIRTNSNLAEILRRKSITAQVPPATTVRLATVPSAEVPTGTTVHVATAASAVQRSEASANSSQPSPARAASPEAPNESPLILPVNSSHHQSADTIGQDLRIAARCSADGIIEALEGTAPDHFVLAVQWHPERSVEEDESSRNIFRALVEAARHRHKESKTPAQNSKAGTTVTPSVET
jgi:putative glutamine amidotransferase